MGGVLMLRCGWLLLTAAGLRSCLLKGGRLVCRWC